MSRIRRMAVSCMALSILMGLPLVHAQEMGPNGPRAKMGQRIQEIFSQLDLTDDQKKALEANKQQHRLEMQKMHQDMRAAHQALQAELMKPVLDMDKIKGLNSRIKTLMEQAEDMKLNSILAVRSILTPEQFIKFNNLLHKHREIRG